MFCFVCLPHPKSLTLLGTCEKKHIEKYIFYQLPKRSGLECRLQWCNFGHPDVNRTAWTKEEDKKLIKLAKDPQNNWDIIAQRLQVQKTILQAVPSLKPTHFVLKMETFSLYNILTAFLTLVENQREGS